MELAGYHYAAVFLLTAALSLVLTPLALRLAVRRKILDHPSDIKAQTSPVPYLGGLAMIVSFTAAIVAGALVRPPTSGLDELLIIMGLALVLALVGLADDLRGLSPWLRLAIEIGCAVAVWATPAGPDLSSNEALNLLVTILWIVVVTNAFNLLDNMDGLSAGVAAIAASFVFLLAVENGQFLVAVLAIAVSGCSLGFLRSNFHPARIYMGDAGALSIGFLIAVLTIKLDLVDVPPAAGIGVPLVILGVPLFDTTLVTVNRIRHGQSPLRGGRDHVSHRLVFVGIPIRATVALIYLGATSLGCLALALAELDLGTGLVLLGWLTAVALSLGALLSFVPVYESSRRRRLMIREVREHEFEPLAGMGPADEQAAS